ncbi:ComE operon protein 1 [Pirellulimonas nuda]|uniref:ComE operon protein 1 n=1 Tax=Pirellulimonas nuda TaxID=2528009 RepID=A0A518D7R8_9BACT|nr:helix-hairpin-helix domain-containing protein [Pirellulimonas nuda]QDU87511.1 ComE operon protein 1 [Pirellulimonas nuda]
MTPPGDRERKPLLHPRDQWVLASLTCLAIASMAWWWAARGGLRGDLVDIDHAGPLRYAFVVDVNTADWGELAQLPKVGPVLAKRIVATRDQHGPFRSAEDLQRVPGIGPRTLAGVRRYLAPLPDDEMVAAR